MKDSVSGLTAVEAAHRLALHGPNELPSARPTPLWRRFVNQFRSALIYVLLFALVIDLTIWLAEGLIGWPFESVAILFILLLNAGLGVYQESKAEVALARLRALAGSYVWVMRDGFLVRLPSAELVPGDLVRLDAGDRIPADGELIEAQDVFVDESIVTGESLPMEKSLRAETLSGTLVVRGKAFMQVTRTGVASTAGSLAAMVGAIESDQTPLEKRLRKFGARVARWIVGLAALITIGELVMDGFSQLGHILLFAAALAVAAIPEGLPAVVTLTLALGVERMARKKAVVRRLSAVEALGSVTVIATDKTGTLTENRMMVKEVDTSKRRLALRAMVLVNDADAYSAAGDPIDLALIDYARKQGLNASDERSQHPRRSVLAFDSANKLMRVTVEENGRLVSYLKGAPEVLIQRSRLSADERQSWREKAEGYASEGLRVLAIAWGEGEREDELFLIGVVLLWDPPRVEVPEAIRQAQAAGIRVVMVTGDHPATAVAVANEVGIPTGRVITGVELETLSPQEISHAVKEANVFARVNPQDKLRLIEALKAQGEIVAVTGDGINDAPALKRADVSVAMGERGSDVSREVADLVLLDDNFATIVAAMKEGRNIYENIQKFIRFLFAANFALTLIVITGALGSFFLNLRDASAGLWLPLTAIQLLWINVITNGPPAFALGLDQNHGLMRQSPRNPFSPLLDGASLRFIFIVGAGSALIGGILLVLLPEYGFSLEASRTLLFVYATISQLLLAYSARRTVIVPGKNIALHFVVVLCLALQLLTLFVPGLRSVLGVEVPNLFGLAWVGGAILLSWSIAEVYVRLPKINSFRADRGTIGPTRRISLIKRMAVAIVGFTILLIGIAMLVLPGPAFIVIPLGLAILATEFVWAKIFLKRAQHLLLRAAGREIKTSSPLND